MLGYMHHFLAAGRFVKNIAVRQRNTFRRAGRPGCIDQNRKIVRLGRSRLLIVIGGPGRRCPIVKRIWTPTWALWSGGLCFVWLAVLNVVCDIGGYKRWGFPFLVIGANSITAYVMSSTVKEPISIALERHFGYFIEKLREFLAGWFQLEAPQALKPLILGVLTLGMLWLILLWMYRKRIFIKI